MILYPKVAPGQKEPDGEQKKWDNKALLMPVKPGRDKTPNLVQDHRRSQKNAGHQSDFEIQIEGIGRAEVGQMRIHVVFLENINNRLLNEGIDLVLGKIPANAKTNSHGSRGTDDALAQLFQMLQQAHGAQLAAIPSLFPFVRVLPLNQTSVSCATVFFMRSVRRLRAPCMERSSSLEILAISGSRCLRGVHFFKLKFADFIMNLALELIAGPFELCHEFAPGAGEFR